jgi:hypothetical protein
VCVAHRRPLSRRRIPEFGRDWLGSELSTSPLNPCRQEAGRAGEPLEEPVGEERPQAAWAYADETPWQKGGQLRGRGVMVTPPLCGYFRGQRSKEMRAPVFGEGGSGWLRSDGYPGYRQCQQRRRCWAPRRRKAEGLQPSRSAEARALGQATYHLLSDLRTALYQARGGPPVDLTPPFRDRSDAFRRLGEPPRDSPPEKTRARARVAQRRGGGLDRGGPSLSAVDEQRSRTGLAARG